MGVPPELTMDDSVSYLTCVKQTLHEEPAKFIEFLKVLNAIKAQRIKKDSGIARMTELLKGHPRLLLGLNVFLPKAKITNIPPKDNKGLQKCQTIGYSSVPSELLKVNAPAYQASVDEAFLDHEPRKFDAFYKILTGLKTGRVNEASGFARIAELMKDHRNLLLGLSVFLPVGVKITIPPEAKKQTRPEYNKRKPNDPYYDPDYDPEYDPDFLNKLKKRKRKGKNVSPPKKKVKLSKRTVHCKKCGQSGHNSRSCGKRALQACRSSGSRMKASQYQRNTQQVED